MVKTRFFRRILALVALEDCVVVGQG